jgi:hypothetical protein
MTSYEQWANEVKEICENRIPFEILEQLIKDLKKIEADRLEKGETW